MSGLKQQQKLKLLKKRQKRENGTDVNPNKKVCARDVHYTVASGRSKPASLTLPEIGNDKMMAKQTGKHVGGGEDVSNHFPPLLVKAVPQLQPKKSNTLSLASSLHPQQGRCDSQKLTMSPAVAKQGCGNMEGSQLKRGRPMPARLLPIELTRSGSSSALGCPTELNATSKVPDIKPTPAKCSRPESGNVHKRPRVLPSISRRTEELDKSC